jgi:hypothetical protein
MRSVMSGMLRRSSAVRMAPSHRRPWIRVALLAVLWLLLAISAR